jgi:hypothetical protein
MEPLDEYEMSLAIQMVLGFAGYRKPKAVYDAEGGLILSFHLTKAQVDTLRDNARRARGA